MTVGSGIPGKAGSAETGDGGGPTPVLFRHTAEVCGITTALLGLIGFGSWLADWPVLLRLSAQEIPIAPDSSLAFFICGMFLFASTRGGLSDRRRAAICLVSVSFVALYGLLRFVEYPLGVNLIPSVWPDRVIDRAGPFPAGRMSPITGALLFLTGGSLMLVLCPGNRRAAVRDAVGICGALVFLMGFIGTVGYLFGTPLLYGGQIIPLAFVTVVAFVLLGGGLVAAAGSEGVILKPFSGSSIHAHLLRVFLPLTAAMILAHGFLHEIVTGVVGLNQALWEALLTVAFVLIMGVVVARASRSISRIMDAAEAEKKRTEEALRESTHLFQRLARMSPVGIFRTDDDGEIVYVNERWCEIAGTDLAQARGNGWIQAVDPEDREAVSREWSRCVRGKVPFKMEYRFRRPDGLITWVLGQAISEADAADGDEGHVGTITDITPSKQMEKKIIELAMTDQLTGLYNRRGFMILAEQQLKAAVRFQQGMILFFADLDLLKWINDNLGHEEGDRVLVEAAAVLRETFRESDVIARTGGDEFAVLAINTDGHADRLLNRLQERIASANRRQGKRYELSLSVGVAFYDPAHPCSIDALISEADTRMYERKKRKRAGAA